MALRVLFAGSPPFAVPILEALLPSRHALVGVITQPDRPQGRGRKARLSEVAALARGRGLPLLAAGNLHEPAPLEWCLATRPDVFVVASFGQILREPLLSFARWGALNVHASLLPRWRGASPVAAAILAGDRETGVSIQRIVPRLDAGPICGERRTAIGPEETAGELTQRLAILGGNLLLEVLDSLEQGKAHFETQDETLVTTAPKLTKGSGQIDWSRPTIEIERRVRAMNPWPGATTRLFPTEGDPRRKTLAKEGVAIRILRVRRVETLAPGSPPGILLGLPTDPSEPPPTSLGVATGDGALTVLELQPESGNVMAGADFLRGKRLTLGARFQS